ncbi:MAG: acyl-CoA dehydrogenase [Gammaproteobacteria bacterium]|nr:acyl-CoA dehydrogenase [Gammaproteobacteria bacterium]
MQYQLSDSDLLFRDDVRGFLSRELPPAISDLVRYSQPVPMQIRKDWTRKLHQQGWAAPNWPVEYGGTGWSMSRRQLFEVEMRTHNAPELEGFGFNMVGPAIIRYGSTEQKDFFLPKILNAEINWCQGYSEPQSGSDLASLKTLAAREGDDYLINGSKIWTSAAEHADYIFALVRTDPSAKKQLGISFLLIDMTLPGIEVRPVLAFNGKRLWNQVFFTDVRVPRQHRLGDENQGWTVAKNLLGNERLMVSRVAENKRILSRLHELLATSDDLGGDLEASFYKRLAELEIRLSGLEATASRLLSRFDLGQSIGAEPSMLKLLGSQLVQELDRLLYEVIGYYGLPEDAVSRSGDVSPAHSISSDMIASAMFHHRGYTIAGGTSEVQHNIIAKQVLEL